MILPTSNLYNYHSHTQFCDGRASMQCMAESAFNTGMEIWGFSPHSPIPVDSGCNMDFNAMDGYIAESCSIKEKYGDKMKILTGMEIDFISSEWGPHVDYFQNLPLDYSIGSIHFVPNQDGIPIDCDGSLENFSRKLKEGFNNDLRYVVERFYEQELLMIECGGFDILGHFDKIAANASGVNPDIESYGWYGVLVDDVIRNARDAGYVFEINTKAIHDRNRFFPAANLWKKLPDEKKGETLTSMINKKLLVNSDAHYTEKVNLGRNEAFTLLNEMGI